MTSLDGRGEFPTLGPVSPALQCNRRVSGSPTDPVLCGRPAQWHVIVTSDLENALLCDEHMREMRAKWAYYAAHPHQVACSMRGSFYLAAENVCAWDEAAFR